MLKESLREAGSHENHNGVHQETAVLTYYALVFAISWGGVLVVVGPTGFPGTGPAPDSHGDSRMSRDRGKGEHGAVIFIGSAKEVTGGEITKNRGRHVLHFDAAHRCTGSEDAGAVETRRITTGNRRK